MISKKPFVPVTTLADIVASGTYVHLRLLSPCVPWLPVPAVLDAIELSSNPKKPSVEFAVPIPVL